MWKMFIKAIRNLLRNEEVEEPRAQVSEADWNEILRELGILFEAEAGEGTKEFFDKLEKDHPNSRFLIGKRGSRAYGLLVPEGYRLDQWIEHRVKEVLAEAEGDDNNKDN